MPSRPVAKGPSAVIRAVGTRLSSASFFNRLRSFTSEAWRDLEDATRLKLFKRMAVGVPAYKQFLRDAGISAASIKSAKELTGIPPVSKTNYLRIHELKELFWDGSMRQPHVLTSTSGSTGKPTYFGRSSVVDDQSSLIHELLFRTSSLSADASTLVIVCFGMGVWIGGLITYQAFELMARRGYPVSVLAPGINKSEILKALTDLAPQYDQIILAGYPPFLKDVVDEAVGRGISFAKHRTMLLFAAEAFTEKFREHVGKKANIANLLTDTVNIYGSADLGTMAFETPLSILVRRLVLANKAFFADLFGPINKTPTLAQYIPDFVSFEKVDGELVLSGDSALPLLRYAIGDHGGVHTYTEIVALAKKHGIDLAAEVRAAGIGKYLTKLPFVHVYERIDFSTTLYGLQIYPETIKEVLLHDEFSPYLTGKLALTTKYDHKQDQYLEINLEQKPGVEMGKVLSVELLAEIIKNLREKNSEFRELSDFLGDRSEPKLVFWPYEDPLYFKPGIKQKWVIKPN